ncbi:5'-nucleotidase [Streptomyces sp. NPDC058304]|uniref:5'-nucleotidase n=1 Tax=Streptomyces sp. NPDC058304 TaxID=3346437 RepID=UPI0036E20D1B
MTRHSHSKSTHPDLSSHHVGRRTFLTAMGTAAATFATGIPAHATDLVADWALWAGRRPTDPENDANIHPNIPAQLALVAAAPRVGQAIIAGDLVRDTASGGAVTFGRTWKAVGFGDPIVSATVTGRQIHDALEQQWTIAASGELLFAPLAGSKNVRYTFYTLGRIGDRVNPADVFIDGVPLNLTGTYRLAFPSYTFLANDGYGALGGFQAPYRHQRDFESFVAYIRETQTLTPAPLNRVTAANTTRRGAEVGIVLEPAPLLLPDGTPMPLPEAAIVSADRPHTDRAGLRPPC